jgi:hypothetical protein
MSDIAIVRVERLELAYAPRPAVRQRAPRRDRSPFVELKRRHPGVWNGRMLLLHDHAIGGDLPQRLSRDQISRLHRLARLGISHPAVRNCFAAGAIRASDSAFVLGVMGPQTANAGKIYFPPARPTPAMSSDKQSILPAAFGAR